MAIQSQTDGRRPRPRDGAAEGRGTKTPGHTLLELLVVLVLLGVGAAATVPSVRRFADEAAVAEAREQAVRALFRGRSAAVENGRSVVTILASPPSVRVTAGGAVVHDVRLGDSRTQLLLSRRRDSLTLRFDALGIGRFTSATIAFRRGEADAALVLSSYGRVRRR